MLSAESGMEEIDFIPAAESMPVAFEETKTDISMEGGTGPRFRDVDIEDPYVAMENNLYTRLLAAQEHQINSAKVSLDEDMQQIYARFLTDQANNNEAIHAIMIRYSQATNELSNISREVNKAKETAENAVTMTHDVHRKVENTIDVVNKLQTKVNEHLAQHSVDMENTRSDLNARIDGIRDSGRGVFKDVQEVKIELKTVTEAQDEDSTKLDALTAKVQTMSEALGGLVRSEELKDAVFHMEKLTLTVNEEHHHRGRDLTQEMLARVGDVQDQLFDLAAKEDARAWELEQKVLRIEDRVGIGTHVRDKSKADGEPSPIPSDSDSVNMGLRLSEHVTERVSGQPPRSRADILRKEEADQHPGEVVFDSVVAEDEQIGGQHVTGVSDSHLQIAQLQETVLSMVDQVSSIKDALVSSVREMQAVLVGAISGAPGAGGGDSDSEADKRKRAKRRKDERDRKKRKKDSKKASGGAASGGSGGDDSSSSEGEDSSDSSISRGGGRVKDIFKKGRRSSFMGPAERLAKSYPERERALRGLDVETDVLGKSRSLPLTVNTKPTEKDLFFSNISVPSILRFVQNAEFQQQRYNLTIYWGEYMSEEVKSQVENTIKREKRERFRRLYKDLKRVSPDLAIMRSGSQCLTNEEIYDVLKFIALPVTKVELEEHLSYSQYPGKAWDKFGNEENILKNFRMYITYWIQYQKNFDRLLDVLRDDSTKQFFPEYLKTKGGVKGLIDYFLDAAPNPKFAKQVMLKGIPARKLNSDLSWDQFKDLYVDALEEHSARLRTAKDTGKFSENSTVSKVKPPREYMRAVQMSRHAKRSEGVHHMAAEDADAESHPDNALRTAEAGAYADEGVYDDDELDDQLYEDEERMDEAGAETETELATLVASVVVQEEDRNDEWLHYITGPSTGKPVCYEYAAKASCSRGDKCRFSHDPKDIEHWKKMKELGPAVIDGYKRSVQMRQSHGGSQPAPKDTSPGVRAPFRDPRAIKTPQRVGGSQRK